MNKSNTELLEQNEKAKNKAIKYCISTYPHRGVLDVRNEEVILAFVEGYIAAKKALKALTVD
jgi:hypothetical protein